MTFIAPYRQFNLAGAILNVLAQSGGSCRAQFISYKMKQSGIFVPSVDSVEIELNALVGDGLVIKTTTNSQPRYYLKTQTREKRNDIFCPISHV